MECYYGSDAGLWRMVASSLPVDSVVGCDPEWSPYAGRHLRLVVCGRVVIRCEERCVCVGVSFVVAHRAFSALPLPPILLVRNPRPLETALRPFHEPHARNVNVGGRPTGTKGCVVST